MTSASNPCLPKISAHTVRTVRHLESGSVEYTRQECVITIGGEREELDGINRITFDGETITVDQKAGLVRHQSHTDPLVRFHHEGEEYLQIFLHDTPPESAPKETFIFSNGTMFMGSPERMPTAFPIRLETEIAPYFAGHLGVKIDATRTIEVIEQRVVLGRYEEHRGVRFGGGNHPIPARHSDAFGVVVSSHGIHGGIEHKHQILGRFGYPSGRTLLRDGRAFGSGQTHPNRFKSALAPLDHDGRVGGVAEPWNGFDEIEVWCDPARRDEAEAVMEQCPIPWSIRTYGRALDADVLTLNPNEEPPAGEQRFSYNLFGTGEEFLERLKAAIRNVDDPRLIERLWVLNAEEPTVGEERYGIAWTTHVDDTTRTERAKIRELRHRAIGVTKVDADAAKAACIPLPHPCGEAGFTDAIGLLSRQPIP